MTTWSPKFKLYQSDGITEVYTFTAVNYTNAPQSAKQYVEHKNFRGKGALYIEGGDDAWDLTLKFSLYAENYEDIVELMDELEATVVLNTPYYLKIDKKQTLSSGETPYSYKVKRMTDFEWAESLRTNIVEVTANFKVNSW